jgi:hypothetical protein
MEYIGTYLSVLGLKYTHAKCPFHIDVILNFVFGMKKNQQENKVLCDNVFCG